MAFDSLFRRGKRADAARPGFPGEHWLAMAAGLALFLYARRSRSALVRSLVRTAASGLMARAASGRDGVRRVFR